MACSLALSRSAPAPASRGHHRARMVGSDDAIRSPAILSRSGRPCQLVLGQKVGHLLGAELPTLTVMQAPTFSTKTHPLWRYAKYRASFRPQMPLG